MKIKTKPISIITTLLIASLFFVFLFPSFKSEGGTLTETYLYLSRIKAGLDGTAGNEVEMILAFAPSQAFTSPTTVEIFFSPGDSDVDLGAWCRVNGALTVTAVGSGAPDLAGSADIDTPLTGSPSATCTQGASGDYITISNVGSLVAGTTYGVKLENGAGTLGTGNTAASTNTTAVQVTDADATDGIAFGVYLLADDTVEVTAQVSAAPTVDCTLTPTTVNMGVLYPGGVIVTQSVPAQLETGSTGYGYYWAAYGLGDTVDAGLYYSGGPYLIASSSTVVDLSAGNSEGFGITVEPPTGATVPANFQTGTPGQFGGLESGTDGARLILYRDSAAGTTETAGVNYGARASTLALGGTYYEYVTYVCGGYY